MRRKAEVRSTNTSFKTIATITYPVHLGMVVGKRVKRAKAAPVKGQGSTFMTTTPLISFVSRATLSLSSSGTIPVITATDAFRLGPGTVGIVPKAIRLKISVHDISSLLGGRVRRLVQRGYLRLSRSFNIGVRMGALIRGPSIRLSRTIVQGLRRSNRTLKCGTLILRDNTNRSIVGVTTG